MESSLLNNNTRDDRYDEWFETDQEVNAFAPLLIKQFVI